MVDEAQGNGDVVRMLVEAGADMDAKCWDITPLMCAHARARSPRPRPTPRAGVAWRRSAAAGGHYWAVQTLLELGAETNIDNGWRTHRLPRPPRSPPSAPIEP